LRTLERAGVVRELTGRRRDRTVAYDRYVSIVSERHLSALGLKNDIHA